MKHRFSALVAGLIFSTAAMANNPPPTIKADAPNRYVVQKGDTLWHIAGRYLDAPARWQEIWATNQHIKNPHLIYPDDVIIMCLIKGQTLVGIDTGEGCEGLQAPQAAPTNTHLEQVNTAAAYTSQDYVPIIPIANIRQWLNRTLIVSPIDFEKTPYVISSKNNRLITAAGDKVYVKGTPLVVGQKYGLYREGKPYIDTKANAILGLEVAQVATGVVTSVAPNGVSSIEIEQTYGDAVNLSDTRAFLEVDAPVPAVFYPAPAELTRFAKIARVMGDKVNAGKDDVVSVNVGSRQGAKPGHILNVYKKGALVRDPKNDNIPVRLPSELNGQLMIFKVFDNISYAYVLSADLPLRANDLLAPPVE